MRQDLADYSGEARPVHVALRIEIATTGVRQVEVAQRVGVGETQLSKMLRGRKPISDEMAASIRKAIAELAA